MHIKMINAVSPATLAILDRKLSNRTIKKLIQENKITTVGLCSGEFINMMVASDIAEKAADVKVGEIAGLCPQHMTCIGIFGNTASVKIALQEIEKEFH